MPLLIIALSIIALQMLFNYSKNKLVYRELLNYLFLIDTIRKNSLLPAWKSFGLRKDLIGRIYTVISLREEDMGDMEDVKRFKVLEKMRPINDYLTSLGLQEIIIPNIQPVPESRSYLVTYIPAFNQFSWTWLAFNVIFPLGLILQFTLF